MTKPKLAPKRLTKSTARKPDSDVGWEFPSLVMIRARWGQARNGARERYPQILPIAMTVSNFSFGITLYPAQSKQLNSVVDVLEESGPGFLNHRFQFE